MDLFAFARMKMEKKLLELEFHGITLLTARGHQDKHLVKRLNILTTKEWECKFAFVVL